MTHAFGATAAGAAAFACGAPTAAAAGLGLCRPHGSCRGSGLCRLLLGHRHGELARDLGLPRGELDLGLARGVGQRCLLVGGRSVLCLLLYERGAFGTQTLLVCMHSVHREGDIATCDLFVLRSRRRLLLVHEQGLGPVDLRVQVDVGRHHFRLKPLAIAPHPTGVGLDLLLTGSDLHLVALDLGDIDVVLLLVRADLQLLQHEILGDLGRLGLETGHLIGRDGSRSRDHRCGDRGDE